MKSITSLAAVTSVLFAASSMATVDMGPLALACYSAVPNFTFDGRDNATVAFNSDGSCLKACTPGLYGVMATTKGSDCWCGNEIPANNLKVENTTCFTPCTGYGQFTCGGPSAWTVYLTGLSNAVSTAADSSTSATASSTTSAKPSVVTAPGSTVVVTAGSESSNSVSASPTATAQNKSSSPSIAGIAVGVVVGIVAIAAIVGGIFLFLRNRNRREVEEEYRRNAAVNNFINGGGKPPNSSGGASSFTDTRLDATVMAQRRMSDGSIADNQDYSRRILKVTNA